jgi:hypothetical protein
MHAVIVALLIGVHFVLVYKWLMNFEIVVWLDKENILDKMKLIHIYLINKYPKMKMF